MPKQFAMMENREKAVIIAFIDKYIEEQKKMQEEY